MEPVDEFERAWRSPISRRRLLRAAGIGAGTLAFGSLLEACTTESTPGGGQSAATGGTLAVAMKSRITALDPVTETFPGGLAVNSVVYQALYRQDPFPPRVDIFPELATDLPEQLTPTRYRITLREGVTFHDGSALTADDVVFTLERFLDPEASPVYARFLQFIESAEAIDAATLELNLKHPTSLLAERLILVKVLSKAAVEASEDALKLNPVGTGPYRVVSAPSDEELTLEKFADYTGDREITYDSLDIRVVLDDHARVASLLSDQTKVALAVPNSTYGTLQDAADRVVVESVPSDAPVMINFHCGKPPFDDVRVRQAVLFAIDRDAITETTFFGLDEPAWEGFFRPDHPAHAPAEVTYRYDPDRARELLAEAGLAGSPVPIDFLVSNTEPFLSMAPIVEANLREVGFEPTIVPGDYGALVSQMIAGEYSMMLVAADATALGGADAEFQLRWQWYGYVPRSVLFWSGPELDRLEGLLDEALAAGDVESRTRLLADAQQIVQTQVPIGPVHHTGQLTAWSDDLDGFRPLPTNGVLVPDGVTG